MSPILIDPFPGSLSTRIDAAAGITETFLQPWLGGSPTIAVLSAPIGEAKPLSWVVCHSFGMEQMYLQPLEVAAARLLSANGFPVLRFHGRGYGDNHVGPEDVGMTAHVVDVLEAIRFLTSRTGASRVGLIGARFGGAVAALAADRGNVSALALWDPVVNGESYVSGLIQALMAEELAGGRRDDDAPTDPIDVLASEGVVEVQGYFPLGRTVFERISSIDLLKQVGTFRGRSLVVQVSRTGSPRSALVRLVDRFNQIGGNSLLERVVDPQGPLFGHQRYRSTGGGAKRDTQLALSEAILSSTLSWLDAAPQAHGLAS